MEFETAKEPAPVAKGGWLRRLMQPMSRERGPKKPSLLVHWECRTLTRDEAGKLIEVDKPRRIMELPRDLEETPTRRIWNQETARHAHETGRVIGPSESVNLAYIAFRMGLSLPDDLMNELSPVEKRP
jgi:hypothetical protein